MKYPADGRRSSRACVSLDEKAEMNSRLLAIFKRDGMKGFIGLGLGNGEAWEGAIL